MKIKKKEAPWEVYSLKTKDDERYSAVHFTPKVGVAISDNQCAEAFICWMSPSLEFFTHWEYTSQLIKHGPAVMPLVKCLNQLCATTYQVRSLSAASGDSATGCEMRLLFLLTLKLALQGHSVWAGSWRMAVLPMASRHWDLRWNQENPSRMICVRHSPTPLPL